MAVPSGDMWPEGTVLRESFSAYPCLVASQAWMAGSCSSWR
jgi:hypothetical protein